MHISAYIDFIILAILKNMLSKDAALVSIKLHTLVPVNPSTKLHTLVPVNPSIKLHTLVPVNPSTKLHTLVSVNPSTKLHTLYRSPTVVQSHIYRLEYLEQHVFFFRYVIKLTKILRITCSM